MGFTFCFNEGLTLVEVILGSHTSLSLWALRSSNDWSSTIKIRSSSSWSSSIWRIVTVVKVIEVIKHEVHIFLLLSLQMVDDSLIFVDFDSYVSISLTRDGSWFDKVTGLVLIIHVVATLGSRNVWHHNVLPLTGSRSTIDFLLSPSHRLIVKFSTLFLQLIVTNIKCISTKAVVAHPQLIASTEIQTRILLRDVLIDEIELIVIIRTASSSVCGIRITTSAKELLLSSLGVLVKTVVTISVSIGGIVVDIMRWILAIGNLCLH